MVLAIALSGIAAGLAFLGWSGWQTRSGIEPIAQTPSPNNSTAAPSREEAASEAVSVAADSESVAAADLPETDVNNDDTALVDEVGVQSAPDDFVSGLNAYDLGRDSLSEADVTRLTDILRRDSSLRLALMDELRAETDPQRQRWLALLLAETGGDEMTQLGADLVYSGDPVQRTAGLDLLARLQPVDDAARDVIIGILSSESEPSALLETLDTVAVPGFASVDQEAALINQIVPLTSHTDEAVRNRSVAILSRWSTADELEPVLRNALSDQSEAVRTTAVFAVAQHPQLAERMTDELFALAENDSLARSQREGALLALQRISLSQQQQGRLQAATNAMNRRPSRTQ